MSRRGNAARSLESWRAAARVLEGPHGPIAYWDEGDGPVLLLIHGFPTSSWDWSKVWPRLVRNRRVIALDMLGFGLSAKPRDHDYRIAEQASLYETLCQHLGVTSADVLAHDYGDTVAQELLARQPGGDVKVRVRSAVFLNGGLIPDAHRPRLIQTLLAGPLGPLVSALMSRRGFGRSFSAVFGPDSRPDETELDAFWELIAENGGQRISHKLIAYMAERRTFADRWVGALAANLVPQRLICGALDPVSGRHLAEAYRRAVPQADVVLLDAVGHYPQAEDPDAVIEAFESFHAGLANRADVVD